MFGFGNLSIQSILFNHSISFNLDIKNLEFKIYLRQGL